MSVRRTSGAILKITARQMATASLAVPKSVIKTMVGREAAVASAALGDSFVAGCCEHAEQKRRSESRGRTSRTVRKIISSPRRLAREPQVTPTACRKRPSIHEARESLSRASEAQGDVGHGRW